MGFLVVQYSLEVEVGFLSQYSLEAVGEYLILCLILVQLGLSSSSVVVEEFWVLTCLILSAILVEDSESLFKSFFPMNSISNSSISHFLFQVLPFTNSYSYLPLLPCSFPYSFLLEHLYLT